MITSIPQASVLKPIAISKSIVTIDAKFDSKENLSYEREKAAKASLSLEVEQEEFGISVNRIEGVHRI